MRTPKLHLKGNKTYCWKNLGGIFFIGYFFDEEQRLHHGINSLEFISLKLATMPLEDLCRNISGTFAIIIKDESSCHIASDAVNFFPIFFSQKGGEMIISDDFETIINERKDFRFNDDAVAEFEAAGFVLGDQTLEKNIFKTNANQILILDNEGGKIVQYQDFITDSFSKKSYRELSQNLENILMNAGEKMLKFLNGRTAIVPLSGGFDSRLIVSVLKRLDYAKVICITYGEPNSEVPISRSVAEKLDFEWHFVDFTQIDIDKIQRKKKYQDYIQFAANGFSMPYLMEYFAVEDLLENNLIPNDSVFLPGHSGDFLGGSYILKTAKNNLKLNQLPAFIESRYFIFVKKSKEAKKKIRERIKENLDQSGGPHNTNGYSMTVEQWDVQEKLAKFIFHSTSVFNFFGFEHYFPLWDKELVNFFRKVPYEYRENKKMYDAVLEEKFFMKQNISFGKKELKNSQIKIAFQKIKDSLRYFFPWKMVLKKVNKADWPYYRVLTQHMMPLVENQGKKIKNFKNYNAVICIWYIKFLREKYKTEALFGTKNFPQN